MSSLRRFPLRRRGGKLRGGNRAGGRPRPGPPDGREPGRCAGLVSPAPDPCEPTGGSRGSLRPSRARAPSGNGGSGGVLRGPPHRRLLRTRAASSWGFPPQRVTGENILKRKDACGTGGRWVRIRGRAFLRLEMEPRQRPACHGAPQFVRGWFCGPFLKKNLLL